MVESEKCVRIFMDGAFDMMHYGHMNAFRLGRSLGTQLIVGVNSDESIKECKGPSVMNDFERTHSVAGCRWVDEVVLDVPYVMSEEYLDYVIKEHNVDFVVHGDDPCIVNGKDVYETAKQAGKYKSIPRTEGISTTDIVGRMLLLTRSHHDTTHDSTLPALTAPTQSVKQHVDCGTIYVVVSDKLATSQFFRHIPAMLSFLPNFSASIVAPVPKQRVVYLAGSWDMLHAGHIATLKKAHEFGDYVLVGVHSDVDVNAQRGDNFPILAHYERVLSVLGCKWVDNVLVNAPIVITKQLIDTFNVSVVLKGTVEEGVHEVHPYDVPKELDILQCVESELSTTVVGIAEKIHGNFDFYRKRHQTKQKAQDAYSMNKKLRQETKAAATNDGAGTDTDVSVRTIHGSAAV